MAKDNTSKTNLGDVTSEVYGLLSDLEDDDRTKILNSVHQLFGTSAPPASNGLDLPEDRTVGSGGSTPQKFFAAKKPANKGEMLAVAAQYRKQHDGKDQHSKDDFAEFFKAARQNFDSRNFSRDIKNAQIQAGFFNTGGPRGQYQLAYYGQQYVDALPDREAAKKLKRPNRKKKTTKVAKKSGTRKKSRRRGS